MKLAEQRDYEHKRKRAEEKKAFEKVAQQRQDRRSSTGDLLAHNKYEEEEKIKINNMAERLVKI